ncbi:uncharacterized protein LOC126998657 isoform X2 [Eriocheir sinensis]|nr:uncharacterized protein LOC126998657 isoform X2 [Eriocheir sinensis]XP_050716603.1 uncharacterized protein LOC126998657 isoform X2 [Eriocheir sinensis]XP_050716613.1 uncharacterized protein LOC126998657 isoform X2 [Eriocheir sinensis]
MSGKVLEVLEPSEAAQSCTDTHNASSDESRVQSEIEEDLVDPCKVYVSNLRKRVTERMLHEALAHYAAVEKAVIIKDKHTRRSKGSEPSRSRVTRMSKMCRRWQTLLHWYLSKMTRLEISEESLGISPPFTKAIVSKLLTLCGPSLRSLKVQDVDFATRQNILQIVGQLCPHLEHLDVTKARGINFIHISRLAQGCKNIKGFVARNCIDFDEKALHHLLACYPQLEKLNVSGTAINGKNLSMLPTTLKELYFMGDVDEKAINRKIVLIADKCPNIEVLDTHCRMSKEDLEYLGKTCHNLAKLALVMPESDFTNALSNFKKLKELRLVVAVVDLAQVFTSLPQLRVVHVTVGDITSEEVDFSILKELKSLSLSATQLSQASLQSLARCSHLEAIYLFKCHPYGDFVLDLLKGCPKLKHVTCPYQQFSTSFVTKVDQIMKGRPGKVMIRVQGPKNLMLSTQYDRSKIEFHQTCTLTYLPTPLQI